MYCKKCEAQIADNAYNCVQCGELVPQAASSQAPPQRIPNYLAQAIIVTLLCCLPLGIPAIVFAAQVNGKIQAGDIPGAMQASRRAKMWCWWSFGVGLGATVLWFASSILLGVADGCLMF